MSKSILAERVERAARYDWTDPRGLTLKWPWPWVIDIRNVPSHYEPKRDENRPKPWKLGTYLLHAGQGADLRGLDLLHSIGIKAPARPTFAGIFAVANITRVCRALNGCDCSWWAVPGQYHHRLDDVFILPEPVPHKGTLGPWRPSPEAIEAVREQVSGRVES